MTEEQKEKILKTDGVKIADKVPNEDYKSTTKIDMTQKMPYIENVVNGTIVAFKLPNGKVKSAMVMAKSNTKRKLKLETEYGKTFIVDFNDVVWVKTGNRFPKGVYEALKGKGAHRDVCRTEEKA